MQYMLLIYEDEAIYGPGKQGPAMGEMVARHYAFHAEVGAARVGGGALQGAESATTLRQNGSARTIHDGPFAESREQLGGYYLIDVADLDAAIAVAQKLPLQPGGAVEVRPLLAPALLGPASLERG